MGVFVPCAPSAGLANEHGGSGGGGEGGGEKMSTELTDRFGTLTRTERANAACYCMGRHRHPALSVCPSTGHIENFTGEYS